MTDEELIARLRSKRQKGNRFDSLEYEAADRIEALEAKLATCEKYRDAYAEMGRIGTQTVRDLEAKLAKAVEIGDKMAKSIEGNYYIPGVVKEWRATISDLKQEVSKT